MPDYNMLFQAPNAGAAFAQSFEHAQQQKQQNALIQQQMQEHGQDRQMKMQQMQAEQAQAAIAQHRDSIILGGKIIRQIQPKDDASWQQAKALYVQAGGDPTDIPDHFDPQYVQSISSLADALDPQKAQQDRLVTPQPGGGIGAVGADGAFHWVVTPNDGSQPAGAPANLPRVSDQSSYDAVAPGAQYMTPDGHVRVKGGQSGGSSAGGFSH